MARTTTSPPLFSRLTDGYIALLLSLFLLWPGRGGYANITAEKFRLFFLLTALYGGAMLVLMIELRFIGQWKPPSVSALWKSASLPQKLVLGFWLWSGLSTLCSPYPQTAFFGTGRLDGFLTLSLFMVLFLLVSTFGRPAKWQLGLFGISMSLCCVLSLIQSTNRNPLLLYPEGMGWKDGYIRYASQFMGTIGNIDLLSAVLCIAIPLFWVSILRLRSKQRFLLCIPLALCLTVLLIIRVEAGFVGVFGGVLLTLPVVAPLSNPGRKRLAIAAGVLALLALAGIYFFGSHLPGFLYELSELLHGRWNDNFGTGRLYIWRNTIPLLGERPLVGTGPDTLNLRCDLQFKRYHPSMGLYIVTHIDNAHNEYLNIALNQGIPALLFYLGAFFTAAFRWVKDAPASPACAILGSAVLGYCIQAFFGLASIITTPFLWLAFALLLCANRTSTPSPKRRTPT